ncbi:MAG TPA: tRNA pseudouridine(55) synthase TruB [Flavobacteriales bacterium]|nr:tRNA pseudouridine(55) synthase TruB [Flavobacteriales bacterium]|tara:strand:+ start:9718 stop:10416 length:699 start_codon:yes stop_codon:yes gene_type:complete
MNVSTELEDLQNGQLFLVDKPLHWTSFNAVSKLKYLIKRKHKIKKIKVGHAGTLDPLATGLLIICTGKFTKKINEFQALPKTYTGTITIGASTPSFDLETEVDQTFPFEHITKDEILSVAQSFEGEQMQVAPQFSAKRIDGKRAYEFARKGEQVEIKANNITIHSFEITNIDLPNIDFKIQCSKGTYIRAIARDFGLKLKNAAHLTALRRTEIGSFNTNKALTIEELDKIFT